MHGTYLLKTLQILTYVFDWVYRSVTYFFLYRLPSLSLSSFFILFDLTDEVLSINPSAHVFVFGDFNVHHKDWLTYSGGTDRTGGLCHNFSILDDLTQTDSHGPALLDLVLLTLVFVLQWLSFHWEILMLLSQFPLTSHQILHGISRFIA